MNRSPFSTLLKTPSSVMNLVSSELLLHSHKMTSLFQTFHACKTNLESFAFHIYVCGCVCAIRFFSLLYSKTTQL